jgi:hypothetical protein
LMRTCCATCRNVSPKTRCASCAACNWPHDSG